VDLLLDMDSSETRNQQTGEEEEAIGQQGKRTRVESLSTFRLSCAPDNRM
jgi:hypothetical protein